MFFGIEAILGYELESAEFGITTTRYALGAYAFEEVTLAVWVGGDRKDAKISAVLLLRLWLRKRIPKKCFHWSRSGECWGWARFGKRRPC